MSTDQGSSQQVIAVKDAKGPPPRYAARNKAIVTALLKGASLTELATQYALSVRRITLMFRSIILRVAPQLRAFSIPEVRDLGQVEELCRLIAKIPDEQRSGAPLKKGERQAIAVVLPPPTERMKNLSALERRIRGAKRQDFSKPLNREEIIRLTDRAARAAFYFLDEATLAGMSGRELLSGIHILLTQRQLASGEPTAILSHAEREKIDQLAPRVLAECRRRGIVIDAVKTEYALVPGK